MKEEDSLYVECETLTIIKLYIEAYITQKEKGFKTLQEREQAKAKVRDNILDVLNEHSEYLGINIGEILEKLKDTLEGQKQNKEILEKCAEEWSILGEILAEIEKSQANTRNAQKQEER